jgi:hypothetical protein
LTGSLHRRGRKLAHHRPQHVALSLRALFKNKDWLDAYTSEGAALLADRPSFPENPISPYQINSPDEENHDLHSEQFAGR